MENNFERITSEPDKLMTPFLEKGNFSNEKRKARLLEIENRLAEEKSSGNEGGEKEMELEKEKKVLQYLIENFPETEERIAVPMDSACQVAIVIPVYGEREFIFRPLEALTVQEGVSPEDFEAIFVINNPGKTPEKNEETDADYARKVDHYNKAIYENQEVLRIIERINGIDAQVELNPEEERVVEKIRNLGIRIFAIDKASAGKTFPAEEANVGGARNRGVAEAVARFYEQKGKNGIIVQTDGDSFMRSNHLTETIRTFRDQPELVGIAGGLKFENIGEVEFSEKVYDLKKMEEGYDYLKGMIEDVDFEEELRDDYEGHNNRVHFSGANMISRAYEAAMVGGVKKIGGGEDPAFGDALSKIGRTEKIRTIEVLTADRFSPRTDVECGHGQCNIQLQEIAKDGKLLVAPAEGIMLMENILKKFSIAFNAGTLSVEYLREAFSFQGKQILDDEELTFIVEEAKKVDKDKDRLEVFLKKIEPLYYKTEAFIFNDAFSLGEVEKEAEKLIGLYLKENPHIEKIFLESLDYRKNEDNKRIEESKKNLRSMLEIIFEDQGRPMTFERIKSRLLNNAERLSFKITPEAFKGKKEIGVVDDLVRHINESTNIDETFNRFIADRKDLLKSLEEDEIGFLITKLFTLAEVIYERRQSEKTI